MYSGGIQNFIIIARSQGYVCKTSILAKYILYLHANAKCQFSLKSLATLVILPRNATLQRSKVMPLFIPVDHYHFVHPSASRFKNTQFHFWNNKI